MPQSCASDPRGHFVCVAPADLWQSPCRADFGLRTTMASGREPSLPPVLNEDQVDWLWWWWFSDDPWPDKLASLLQGILGPAKHSINPLLLRHVLLHNGPADSSHPSQALVTSMWLDRIALQLLECWTWWPFLRAASQGLQNARLTGGGRPSMATMVSEQPAAASLLQGILGPVLPVLAVSP